MPTKITKTERDMAMLDDSATHYGWTTDAWQDGGFPGRTYTNDKRMVSFSCYPQKGIAALRIRTWGGRFIAPGHDFISEIMAELASNIPGDPS